MHIHSNRQLVHRTAATINRVPDHPPAEPSAYRSLLLQGRRRRTYLISHWPGGKGPAIAWCLTCSSGGWVQLHPRPEMILDPRAFNILASFWASITVTCGAVAIKPSRSRMHGICHEGNDPPLARSMENSSIEESSKAAMQKATPYRL